MKCSLRYTWYGRERRRFCWECEAVDGLSDSPRMKSLGRDGVSCCWSRRRNTAGCPIRVGFWCVRGRVDWAIQRNRAWPSSPVSKSLDLRPAHTPYGGSRVRPPSPSKRLDLRPAHTPYGGSRVRPPSPSKRLDLRPAHTPYGWRALAPMASKSLDLRPAHTP